MIEFADWAFLESLVRADEGRLAMALRLFADADGNLSRADLVRAIRGALGLELTLQTQFWESHLRKHGLKASQILQVLCS